MTGQEWHRVAGAQDIAKGKTQRIEVNRREILLCHTSDGLYAVDNLCTHAAARLCEGKLKGNRLLCPLHGAAFDVRDGSALTRPASIPLATYPVSVEGDSICLHLNATGAG